MIKTAPIGQVGSFSLAPGWINLVPYEKLANGRVIVARTNVIDGPYLYYVEHVIQPDEWEKFVQMLDSKLDGETLSQEELRSLSFVLNARIESSAYYSSFHKETLLGRDGLQGWVSAPDENLNAMPFIYPIRRTPQILIEEIGCEGTTSLYRQLWVEGLTSLTKSVEWLNT